MLDGVAIKGAEEGKAASFSVISMTMLAMPCVSMLMFSVGRKYIPDSDRLISSTVPGR